MTVLSIGIFLVYSNSGRFKNTPHEQLEEIAGTNISAGNKNTSTTGTKAQVDTTIKTVFKDNVSIWVYDFETKSPVKNREIKEDTLTPKQMVKFINSISPEEIHLDFVKVSHDTIYVKIKESTYLTQSIGTTGTDEYISTTTYTLTELKNIKYVNYDFIIGDHVMPGTYSRKDFANRIK